MASDDGLSSTLDDRELNDGLGPGALKRALGVDL